MKAAVVKERKTNPIYTDFKEPVASGDNVVVDVLASALSNVTKMRATGQHYSSEQLFPSIAGTDGVGLLDGKKYYFLATNPPYGTLAEKTLINKNMMIALPDGIDNVTAAAIANPGMSSWVALNRAHFEKGQTVLINGATGVAGSLAVKIAHHFGAKKVIVTGRNAERLNNLNADVAIAFDMSQANGIEKFTDDLKTESQNGVDVVLDYLWGDSAISIMQAVAEYGIKTTTRFVSIGASSGQSDINLPSAILRSSKIELLGSGFGSATMQEIKKSISELFTWVVKDNITIETNNFDLKDIDQAWQAPLKPRAVVKVQ